MYSIMQQVEGVPAAHFYTSDHMGRLGDVCCYGQLVYIPSST